MVQIIESHVGQDNNEIVFPGVSSCMTVTVVLSDGSLVGMHLTIGTDLKTALTMLELLGEFLRAKAAAGLTVHRVVLAGVMDEWSDPSHPPKSGPGFIGTSLVDTLSEYLRLAGLQLRQDQFEAIDCKEIDANTLIRVTSGPHEVVVSVDKQSDFGYTQQPAVHDNNLIEAKARSVHPSAQISNALAGRSSTRYLRIVDPMRTTYTKRAGVPAAAARERRFSRH